MQDAYENYCLWALSPYTVLFISELDLLHVLGSGANVEVLIGMVDKI